jgi:multimeric flavodoxin WrbA
MKAILLDGSQENDYSGERVRTTLEAELKIRGWEVEHIVLREKKIGNCAGDFFCWIRSPGMCNVDDDNRIIAASIITSDLLVYLTPVTFGGYSSTLKRMVDHQIQNIAPFFAQVEGETHHQKRYQKHPDLLVVGWMDGPDDRSETVFRHLAQRNALNFYAEKSACGVVLASQTDDEILVAMQNWLNELQLGRSIHRTELPVSNMSSKEPVEIRRALLLVGSPKTRKSTSNSLGVYLFEQLIARAIQTETLYPYTILRSPAKLQAMLEAVEAADLVMLTFPLYVDTLPGPVIEALELIASHRQGRDSSQRQLFTAISNCGFPEAHHNANALAICELFAQQAGFEWAGGLALGAGEIVAGEPLIQSGGKTIRMRQSLDLAADELAMGKAIPKSSQEIFGKPVIPHWAYRFTGAMRWNKQAKGFGVKKLLKRQPYLPNIQ